MNAVISCSRCVGLFVFLLSSALSVSPGLAAPVAPNLSDEASRIGRLAESHGGGVVVTELSSRFIRFAGSYANVQNLINGLRAGAAIRLTSPHGAILTFNSHKGKMSYDEVYETLKGAIERLRALGIYKPVPQQIKEALLESKHITGAVRTSGTLSQVPRSVRTATLYGPTSSGPSHTPEIKSQPNEDYGTPFPEGEEVAEGAEATNTGFQNVSSSQNSSNSNDENTGVGNTGVGEGSTPLAGTSTPVMQLCSPPCIEVNKVSDGGHPEGKDLMGLANRFYKTGGTENSAAVRDAASVRVYTTNRVFPAAKTREKEIEQTNKLVTDAKEAKGGVYLTTRASGAPSIDTETAIAPPAPALEGPIDQPATQLEVDTTTGTIIPAISEVPSVLAAPETGTLPATVLETPATSAMEVYQQQDFTPNAVVSDTPQLLDSTPVIVNQQELGPGALQNPALEGTQMQSNQILNSAPAIQQLDAGVSQGLELNGTQMQPMQTLDNAVQQFNAQ